MDPISIATGISDSTIRYNNVFNESESFPGRVEIGQFPTECPGVIQGGAGVPTPVSNPQKIPKFIGGLELPVSRTVVSAMNYRRTGIRIVAGGDKRDRERQRAKRERAIVSVISYTEFRQKEGCHAGCSRDGKRGSAEARARHAYICMHVRYV